MHADSKPFNEWKRGCLRNKKTESEREANNKTQKTVSASLPSQLFKAYAGLKDYEIEFLLKKGNLGAVMK